MKILVVDDNLESLQKICGLVTENNHNCFPATTAKQALGIAFIKKPNLVLIDSNMPEMDGFAFNELLKLNPETDDIPVVFLVNGSVKTDQTKLQKAGVLDTIKKPVSEKDFAEWLSFFIVFLDKKNEINKKQAY